MYHPGTVLLCTHLHTVVRYFTTNTSTDNFLQQKHNVVLYKNPTFHKSVYICQQLLISSMGTTGYPPYIIADHPSFNFIRKKTNATGKQKFCTNDGPGIELCELLWFPCHACKPTVFAVVATPTCPLPPPTTTLFVQQITVFFLF